MLCGSVAELLRWRCDSPLPPSPALGLPAPAYASLNGVDSLNRISVGWNIILSAAKSATGHCQPLRPAFRLVSQGAVPAVPRRVCVLRILLILLLCTRISRLVQVARIGYVTVFGSRSITFGRLGNLGKSSPSKAVSSSLLEVHESCLGTSWQFWDAHAKLGKSRAMLGKHVQRNTL